eukprot:7254944-Lingulodinium_polyedra.AAC.1
MKEDPAGSWTCDYDTKSPPRQIDYVLVPQKWADRVQCGVLDCQATLSDHRPLQCEVKLHGKGAEWSHQAYRCKPIGWRQEEIGYSSLVTEGLDPRTFEATMEDFSKAV